MMTPAVARRGRTVQALLVKLALAAVAAALPAAALVIACSGGHSATASNVRPVAAEACAAPQLPDVIVRTKAPGQPATAMRLGGRIDDNCKPTADDIAASHALDGAGYCTWVALANDNPGYNAAAVPAPPLLRVISATGAGC